MKRMLAVILLAGVLVGSSGCGSLLERNYTLVTEHVDQTADADDATALRAESYADLVSGAQYFVTMGAATGTIHLYQYTGDIKQAVNNARNAILHDDPVGAYALKDVTCEYTHIVSYYECVFSYRYRRTMDQIAAIQSVNGKTAFRRQVADMLTSFSTQLVLKTSSYYESTETVQKEIWEVYYDTPEAALVTPKITVQLYPDRGTARVVEINLDWGVEQAQLEKQSKEVSAAAARMVGQDSGTDANNAWLLYTRLRSGLDWNPKGKSSVYNALVEGTANSEGVAMAYQLLCDKAGITCQVVRGTQKEEVHCWNLITVDGVSWHLDVTAGDTRDTFLRTDGEMEESCSWSREDYPACTGRTVETESTNGA